jgi:hypothetical protein
VFPFFCVNLDNGVQSDSQIHARSRNSPDWYHDHKTASDGSLGCTHEKGQVIEEPDEAKVSSPVLQTSGSCKGVT